jgi:hypothetical protein
MTDRGPTPAEERIGLDMLRADDLLLDALGRGEKAPADDDIAVLLAAWRADVTDETDEPAADSDATEGLAEVIPISRARRRRGVRLGVAAAVLAVVAGGTGVAAAQAGPGSPLWPITHVVNPDRVALVDAESAIADARKAATQGRTADAQRLVDRAATLVSKVRDPRDAARLRTELDDVRHLLATVTAPGGVAGTVPGVPGTSATPGTTPAPGSTPGGGGPAPTPGPTGGGGAGGGGGGATPGLPIPTLPLPTPSLPVPLPTLPILG